MCGITLKNGKQNIHGAGKSKDRDREIEKE